MDSGDPVLAMRDRKLVIVRQPLPYNDALQARSLNKVDLLVIHCTELPTLDMSRQYGEEIVHQDTGTGNSGHFYIDLDGSVYQYVDLDRVAHHVRGENERSVGVELVNAGRFPDWFRSDQQAITDPYPDIQIAALKALIGRLETALPSLAWLAGHDELDTEMIPAVDDPGTMIRRKVDPGPLFPWQDVSASTQLTRWGAPKFFPGN